MVEMSNTTMNQAKRILETHTSGELAAKLGIKSTNFSGLKSGKRPLTEKMAARIVEAYGGKVAKQEKPVKAKGPAKVAEPAEKTGWHAPNKPPSLTRDQQQAKQDMAKLVEEANALLCRMGMAGVARAAIAKVIEDEVAPVLKEMLAKVIEEVRAERFTINILEPEDPALAKSLKEIIERAPRGGHAIAVSKDEADRTRVAVDGVLHVEEDGVIREVPLSEVSFADGVKPDPDLASPLEEDLPPHRWWRRSK
jgi:DNA-binding transcriptional regulator YdaS (Cro superfamily)